MILIKILKLSSFKRKSNNDELNTMAYAAKSTTELSIIVLPT